MTLTAKYFDFIEAPRVELEKESHVYTIKEKPDVELSSCTKFISSFFEPFDKYKIAQKLAGTSKNYLDKTIDDILLEWQHAADEGSRIHQEIEHYILHQSPASCQRSKLAIEWIAERFPQQRYQIFPEVIVCSERLALAGTIDALIYDKKRDIYFLLDWKTNKRITKSAYRYKTGIRGPAVSLEDCHLVKYGLQLSLYQYILESEYNINVSKQALVHIKNKSIKAIACQYAKSNIEDLLSFDNKI